MFIEQVPELIPAVDVLLLEAEDDWTEVLVVGEVVPVLRPIEVLLVGLLLHRGQPERSILLPVLFYRRLLPPGLSDSSKMKCLFKMVAAVGDVTLLKDAIGGTCDTRFIKLQLVAIKSNVATKIVSVFYSCCFTSYKSVTCCNISQVKWHL